MELRSGGRSTHKLWKQGPGRYRWVRSDGIAADLHQGVSAEHQMHDEAERSEGMKNLEFTLNHPIVQDCRYSWRMTARNSPMAARLGLRQAAGLGLALLGFMCIGTGVSACGTNLLVMLAKSVAPERRGPAARGQR